MSRPLAVRWTIGDVGAEGFEALRLSAWGAWRLFGPGATLAVCVNTVPLDRARERAGDLPASVAWHDVTGELPTFLGPHLDAGLAEGAAWKLAPVRMFPDRDEIVLDNDCILWDVPGALRGWLAEPDPRPCLVAEDVAPYFGRFAHLCGPEARNAGIRGLPRGFDLEAALRRLLDECPGPLASEADEQGLQVAALSAAGPPRVVRLSDVSICSPFPPHRPGLGRCGAHFVGLNARDLPWSYEGRPASDVTREHWRGHRGAICERLGLPGPRPAERGSPLP